MDQNQNPFDQFMEHQRKAIDEATKAVDALLPPAFKEHSKAALEEAFEASGCCSREPSTASRKKSIRWAKTLKRVLSPTQARIRSRLN